MAGDWLKIEKDTPDKPEIAGLCALLGIDADTAFAKCFRLWCWADSNTVDGNVRRVTLAFLDSLVHLPGFSQALLDVGWLVARSGSLEFPNFARHMGQPAKARALTAARVAAHKAKTGNAGTVSGALPEERRGEKKRKNKDPPKPPATKTAGESGGSGGAVPAGLDTAEFRAAWADWGRHRAEKRAKLTPTATRQQLAKLAAMGVDRAVAALRHSIAQGYTGVFEDRNGRAAADPYAGGREFVRRGKEEQQ